MLVKLYNASTESEQLKTLKTFKTLSKFDHFRDKKAIIAGDFDDFCNSKIESNGENPILKKHAICKILNLK